LERWGQNGVHGVTPVAVRGVASNLTAYRFPFEQIRDQPVERAVVLGVNCLYRPAPSGPNAPHFSFTPCHWGKSY
jgi:hypothetical protein